MLEKALDRWSSVNIVFEGIFYSGDKLTSRKFHVISVKQELEGPGELEIFFDPQFLEQQRNTQYYKLIDINEYKRLRKPISARLYELLTKNFSARESWKIEISGLCEKLTLKKHYPSQAMQKIIPALNEINANTEMKASVSWFKNSKGDYICHFRQIQPSIEGELSVKEIMTMVPPRKRSLIVENLIKNFKGDQKVLISNLLYSLEKSNRNFSQFFRLALRDDWASHQRLEVRDYVDKFKEKMISFSELVREETGCTDKETISEIVTAAINTNRENGFSDGYLDERMFREFAKGIWREMNCED